MKKGEFFKKGLAMLLAIVMIIGFLPGVGSLEVSAAEAGTIKYTQPKGDGTADNPYQIGTAEELYWFADKVNGEDRTYRKTSAVLTADITVNTGVLNDNGELANSTSGFVKWTPIGNASKCYFQGTFDGQNHTISGLYFDDGTADYVGLFGYLNKGKVSNVGVADSYFNGKKYVGGVCGYMFDSTMKDCHNAGNVNGTENVGGVCGMTYYNIQMENCYNTGKVSGTNEVGGVCGQFNDGTITACYNTGKVNGSNGAENIGGICGYLENCTITNCYCDKECGADAIGGKADSDVTIDDVSGKTIDEICNSIGFHAYRNGICALCGAYQEIKPTTENVYEISNAGQLYWFADKVNNDSTYQSANAVLTADIVVNKNVLKSDGTLNEGSFKDWTPIGTENCSYQGTFDGQKHTISGLYFNNESDRYVGLIGNLEEDGRIINVGVKDSYFKGSDIVGGVCGSGEKGIIENCYFTGNVSGSQYVGGVCGYNQNVTVKNCYNTGNVKATSSGAGGVCGYIEGATIENCYNTGNVSGNNQVGGVYGYSQMSTIKNCYHNIDTGTGYDSKTIGKTTDEFKSGEVAYLLQEGQEDKTKLVWGQKIGSDNSPVLGGSKVYKRIKYKGCEGQPGDAESEIYTNEEKDEYAHHTDDGSVEGSVAYDNVCDVCGKTAHHFVNGVCDAKDCGYHQGVITNVNYKTNIVYSGDVANAEPKASDFTVASGKEPVFTWYQGDVTSGDLPENSLGAAPKEAGTYTLVVTADGAKVGDVIYTAAELPLKVTIEKEPVKTEPKKEDSSTQQPSGTTTAQQPNTTTTTQQPSSTTTAQPPKNGDVITDDKTKAKFEVTDVTKKEVIYNAPTDSKAKDITVPDTVTINGEVYKVTKIADNAFKGNKTVTTITIGSNIQTIGKNAFSGCKKLKTIVIKSKTLTDKKIAKKAFKGISKKTVIKVPKKKLAAYKKMFKKKGLSSKNKVKGY